MIPVKQMQQKIALDDEIISSLKEFFGTSLSDFLKVYRDFQPRQTFFEKRNGDIPYAYRKEVKKYQVLFPLL